jgi:hypothetical protein
MANYLSYGHSAFEIGVGGHTIQRVFFAISVRDHPAWLSWYFYSQGAGDNEVEFGQAKTADSTKKIGDLLVGLAGQPFAIDKHINVNTFADTNKVGKISTTSPATCTLKKNVGSGKMDFVDCTIMLTNKAGHVKIHFVLEDKGITQTDFIDKAIGLVYYVGTTDLKKYDVMTALASGPAANSKWLNDPLDPGY